MTALAAACSLSMAMVACTLLVRLNAAFRQGRSQLRVASSPDDLPQRILHLLRSSLDACLLTEASSTGLADVAVRTREPSDPYRTVAELIEWLSRESASTAYPEICGLIKGVYQLGHSLRAGEPEIHSCLELLRTRLLATAVGGSRVARVEWIRPGTILDPGTMAPLNYGARVIQPLGALVYDADGRVLGKAKVLCG
jgi:hypothetical protein